jgi:DNA-directed RNA polymerase subunit RPC12/RpoP
MSFARKVSRRERRRLPVTLPEGPSGPGTKFPKRSKVAIPLKDVRSEITGAKGEIQCPKCHRSATLVRMTCEEFNVDPQLRAAHDKLAESGHEHVRCTVCNQFIIFKAAEGS